MRKSKSCPSLTILTGLPSPPALVAPQPSVHLLYKDGKKKEKHVKRAFLLPIDHFSDKTNNIYGKSAPSFLNMPTEIVQKYTPFFYNAFHNVAMCSTTYDEDVDIANYAACLASPPDLHEESMRERLETEIEVISTSLPNSSRKKGKNKIQDI